MSTETQSLDAEETPIAALATAAGPAGLCVVRVSGAGALRLGDRLMPRARKNPSSLGGGTFIYAQVVHPVTGEAVDQAVALVFRAPHSYTGEDALEIQGHGGTLPSRRLLEAVLAAGARLAEPGEFTKRAFLNGKMDLTQAEAVCDLIEAQTERAAQVARLQLDGWLGRRMVELYERVTGLCAEVEHVLDFDEGELPDSFLRTAESGLMSTLSDLDRLALSWSEGHLLRDGARVVISGRPNAGKSSLLNALLGSNRAIVHAEPGTTRDIIEETLVLSGVPLRLVDTAGLRDADSPVEREGIRRAREAMQCAEVNLALIDQSAPWPSDDAHTCEGPEDRTLTVLTKCDLPALCEPPPQGGRSSYLRVSSVTGQGLDALKAAILEKLGLPHDTAGQPPIVSLRHVTELRLAAQHVRLAGEALRRGGDHVVIAGNHLRESAEALGRIVGRTYSDDLLDAVFSRFCVGK